MPATRGLEKDSDSAIIPAAEAVRVPVHLVPIFELQGSQKKKRKAKGLRKTKGLRKILKFPQHGKGNRQPSPRDTKIPIQDKPKEKHAKTHTNQTAAVAAKSLQLCLTLCNPIDSSPPGFSIPGILQARKLEWVAIAFSNACMLCRFSRV